MAFPQKIGIPGLVLALALLGHAPAVSANPQDYPAPALGAAPLKVEPAFIKIEALVEEILNKKKPLIVDVRTAAEYDQAHIKGAVSIPLAEVRDHLAAIPKDRLVVFY